MEIIVILSLVFCYFGFIIFIAVYSTEESNKIPTRAIFNNGKNNTYTTVSPYLFLYINKLDLHSNNEFNIYNKDGKTEYSVKIINNKIILTWLDNLSIELFKNRKSFFKDSYEIYDECQNLIGKIIYNRNDLNYFRSCNVYDLSGKELFSAYGKRELFEGRYKSRSQIDFFLYQNYNIVGTVHNVRIRNNFEPDFYEIKAKCEFNQNKIFMVMILLLNLKY